MKLLNCGLEKACIFFVAWRIRIYFCLGNKLTGMIAYVFWLVVGLYMWINGINNLQDLWKSRRCLSKIEGFDHSLVNATLGACGHLAESEESPCLPFFVWQCGEFDVINLLIIHILQISWFLQ